MASKLQTCVTALLAHYETELTTVETFIQSSKEEDLKKYTQDQLPLLSVRLYNTSYEDQYGQEVDTDSPVVISLYYIDWGESETVLQAWIETVLQNTPTELSNHVISFRNNTQVEALDLEYPLRGFRFTPFIRGSASRSDI